VSKNDAKPMPILVGLSVLYIHSVIHKIYR